MSHLIPLLVIVAGICALAGIAWLVRFKGEHIDRGL